MRDQVGILRSAIDRFDVQIPRERPEKELDAANRAAPVRRSELQRSRHQHIRIVAGQDPRAGIPQLAQSLG